MVVAVAVVALLVGVVPVAGGGETATVAAAQTPSYSQGSGPLADVLYWADQKKCKDLTRDELAAMIIVPTYTETGASGTVAPSPMTLSRYDTQSRLYAFSSPGSARMTNWSSNSSGILLLISSHWPWRDRLCNSVPSSPKPMASKTGA